MCLVWFCGAKASTDKSFNKDFSCREVTPLSAHIRACADILDESDCLETLHYIFGPQANKFLRGGREGLSL